MLVIVVTILTTTQVLAWHDVDSVIYRRLKKVEKKIPLEPTVDALQSIRERMYQNRTESQVLLTLSAFHTQRIEEELRKKNMPEELSHLPLSLSAYSPTENSKIGGAGYWNLQYITAIRYGLKITYWIDERMDLQKSTNAAIEYLESLHQLYGDWGLALLSFISSPSEVNAAISRNHGNTNFGILLESMHPVIQKMYGAYVSAIYLTNYYSEYELTPKKLPPTPVLQPVECNQFLKFENLATYLQISTQDLQHWNSIFIRGIVPQSPTYQIKIPVELIEKYKGYKEPADSNIIQKQSVPVHIEKNISNQETKTEHTATKTEKKVTYRVEKGDNLGQIAQKYRVSIEQLKRLNNLKSDVIYVGQTLIIHEGVTDKSQTEKNEKETESTIKETENKPNTATKTEWIYYTVKSGDSVWRIANKHGISESDLIQNNNIKNNLIYPGQRLKIKRK